MAHLLNFPKSRALSVAGEKTLRGIARRVVKNRVRLCLASASPRRLELLRLAGVEPDVLPADIDETQHTNEDPLAYAARLAQEKAAHIARTRPSDVVLGADTVVTLDGDVLGKPTDANDARAMLQRLAGREHQVITAYHLIAPHGVRSRAVTTAVLFRALSPVEIDGYAAHDEWRGKAGGYAIQGLAGAFAREVRGSYSNVVGLPLCEVIEDLRALGALPSEWPR
jgi:septum formation protein